MICGSNVLVMGIIFNDELEFAFDSKKNPFVNIKGEN